MNRRELLQYMVALGAGTLLGSVANAALAGAPLHAAPVVKVFNATHRALVAQLAERIIPTTATPGAITAAVPAFIERMVGEWYNTAERAIFLGGLSDYEHYCREQFGKSAHQCDAAQHDAALTHFEKLASDYKSPVSGMLAAFGGFDEGAPFFTKLKELTVLGYYTSEVGATQELRYDVMPMEYDGDVKLGADDRAWSAGGLMR